MNELHINWRVPTQDEEQRRKLDERREELLRTYKPENGWSCADKRKNQ